MSQLELGLLHGMAGKKQGKNTRKKIQRKSVQDLATNPVWLDGKEVLARSGQQSGDVYDKHGW